MKINRYLLKLTFLSLALLLTFSASADAQRKKPTTRRPATTTTTTTSANTLEAKQTAEKVSIQLKNVTTFLYKLGGVASAIEAIDADARAKKLSPTQISKFNEQKQAVITSIVNLKAGIADLEVQFRTKPSVKNYLFQIQGATDLVTQSEDLARAGRFADSGRVLIQVVGKLADTLTAMP
jgi:hypothetical protein